MLPLFPTLLLCLCCETWDCYVLRSGTRPPSFRYVNKPHFGSVVPDRGMLRRAAILVTMPDRMDSDLKLEGTCWNLIP